METNGAVRVEKLQQGRVGRMVEEIVGCKWSMAVLGMVRNGVHRPGAIERNVPGLTTKVLNERLRKLVQAGVLAREVFPETPPRVDYKLTGFGLRFVKILDMIEELQNELMEAQAR